MDILKNKTTQEMFEKERLPVHQEEEYTRDENTRTVNLSHKQRQGSLLSWQGPEFEVYEKDNRWYAYISLILLAIIGYAVYTNSLIMAIVFILIGVIFYIHLHKEPKIFDFSITTNGVIAGDEIFEFENIRSFWIFYDPPHEKYISIHTKGHLVPFVHIAMSDLDPVELRTILIKYIPEIKQDPSLIDVVERFLRI